jgi:hypothetical protein
MNRSIDFIAGSVMCLLLAPGCGCQENSGSDRDARDDGDLDGEEDAPDRYEGPIAELWEGKIPINVFGSNREFGGGFPTVVPDRSGGVIIVGVCSYCYDPVGGTRSGVVMQRIGRDGEKLWGENGILFPQGWGIGKIFPLHDSYAYVSTSYIDVVGEYVSCVALMSPDGVIDLEGAFKYSSSDIRGYSEINYVLTRDEMLFVSIEQTDNPEIEGDWCFLGLDRSLDSWTGGVRCLFPMSSCEGYNCPAAICGSVHAMLLGVVEDLDGNFVLLYQRSVSDEPQAAMEPGEIYAQTYDRELNQLGEPGCYGSLVGTYDYLCEGWEIFMRSGTNFSGSDIFCWDRIESDQFTPELVDTLEGVVPERLEYVLKFTSDSGYAPAWTPYNTDFIFPDGRHAHWVSNQSIWWGGINWWVNIVPDNIGGVYAFGAYWSSDACDQLCPPAEYFIQHLGDSGRTTYSREGKVYLTLAYTPTSRFEMKNVYDFSFATADQYGNLFYAWLHPINPVDTDWPVDQPIPWGWAYRVCVQKATPGEVNVWPGDPHPCVEVMRYSDILYDTVNSKPIGGLAPDGEGGAIVIFIGAEGKFYAQRVGADGQLMWNARE